MRTCELNMYLLKVNEDLLSIDRTFFLCTAYYVFGNFLGT